MIRRWTGLRARSGGRAAVCALVLVTAALALVQSVRAAQDELGGADPSPTASPVATPAADPDAVHLKAERGLHFDAEAKVLTAEGGVRLTYRSITLEADTLKVDLDRDLVEASGDVRYHKGNDDLKAVSAVYDLKKEAGTFQGVTSKYRGEGMKGDAYVTGSFMESSAALVKLKNSQITTCDLAKPHYHLEAREIAIWVDDRLEARQVSYFEGSRRLFTLPYMVIPLRRENQFELPRFGYSESDGWFVKTTYNYYRNARAFGAYFLDWYEKKGLGVGLKHNYTLGAKPREGSGSTYLYLKGDRPHNDEEIYAGIDHRQAFGPGWQGSLRGTYENRYLSDTQKQQAAGTAVQVTQQTSTGLTDLSASYQLQQTETLPAADGTGSLTQTDIRNARVAFNTVQKLAGGWDWRFGASANRRFEVGTTPYDNLGYLTQVAKAFPDFTFRLSAQQQFNPPQVAEGETPPPWNRYTRFPELTLESRELTYQGRPLPLNFTASVSRYEEYSQIHPEGYALGMSSLTGRLTGLSYPVSQKLTASLNASGTATYYQNGDYTLGATSGLGLTYRPVLPLTATLRYNWQDRLGVNPFTSTGISPAQLLTGNLSYLAGGVTADLSGGYNVLTAWYQDLVGRVSVTRSRLTASGMVSYDPNTATWRRASGILTYQQAERQFLRLGATLDLASEHLERLDVQVATPLAKLWRAEATVSYGGYQNELSRGEVALLYDWHCREAGLRYDGVKREIWAELRIKALPTQVFRFGASEERLMFDSTTLGGLLSSGTSTTAGVPR